LKGDNALEQRPFNHSGFSAYLSEQKLMASRCSDCGQLYLPPRSLCGRCGSSQMKWEALSGAGELMGFTAIHVGLPSMAAEGFDRDTPYCSGVVRLVEGPAVSGQIVGVDGTQPETIQVGMPLRAVFVERGSGEERQVYLAFEKVNHEFSND
jgi:uncharacterized protein